MAKPFWLGRHEVTRGQFRRFVDDRAYRTEAERDGKGGTAAWYSGDDERALREHAWYIDNAGGKTHRAGQKSPNAWGLYDMHGNVWEWCQDGGGDRYYATSPTDDPSGASGGSRRVYRGGGWIGGPWYCRSAFRGGDEPSSRDDYLGFRLARVVSSPSRSR